MQQTSVGLRTARPAIGDISMRSSAQLSSPMNVQACGGYCMASSDEGAGRNLEPNDSAHIPNLPWVAFEVVGISRTLVHMAF